ncbi:Thiosulfate sulfurtransferase, rhodanese [hydrothermal vent metagenome]|uniref:Thiosulfate sulfurtransferase, rhodanese n=1 Tax=hydrothermal vent metagenome TaxID=652676 RepID=A0A3B0VUH0_9ZZZZ
MYKTLIDVQTLAENLDDPNWVIVDCRFSLADTAVGYQNYQTAHIPGAVYAHLDDDLSGPPATDHGRHPLPTPQRLAQLFSQLGIDEMSQVVAYDDVGGMIAARLWWMLRYMGHEAVAVLDGGWQAWQTPVLSKAEATVLPTISGVESNDAAQFNGRPQANWLVTLDDVANRPLLIDSRSAERYRGETEPLDSQAGHIPSALNLPFANHLDNGRFRSSDEMRTTLTAVLGQKSGDKVTFYCGSGVSACVNLLAMTHAGLGNGRLYVGSWSEWSSNPERPIATGSE